MNEIVTVSAEVNVSSHLNCPIFTKETRHTNDQMSFWVGGILVCHMTIAGFILNIITLSNFTTTTYITPFSIF